MAASTTPKPTRVELTAQRAFPPPVELGLQLPVAVAFSGGADSTALLLLCAQQYPGQVQAIHVHHGLQAAADDFAAHAAAFCRQLGVPFHAVHVQAGHRPGQSPEDAARRARYAALSSRVLELNKATEQADIARAAIKTVAIAQHADDQAETLLLALSRGAGLPGLAAMPAHWQLDGLIFSRPLLAVPGQHLREWLAGQGLQARHPGGPGLGQGWVEDPTNQSLQFTRNRIRHDLLPALAAVFPQFRETFARSARHAAQAQELLDALADSDLAATGQPPAISALQALPRARQANLLRRWLREAHGQSASAAQLDELLDQLADCTTRGHQINIKIGTGVVQRVQGALAFSAPL